MNTENKKMPIILIGNTFKYEIEATVKLFVPASRFNFTDDIKAAQGESYVIAKIDELNGITHLTAVVKFNGSDEVKLTETVNATVSENKNTVEHEICRLI